jgi:hypothetical protein
MKHDLWLKLERIYDYLVDLDKRVKRIERRMKE